MGLLTKDERLVWAVVNNQFVWIDRMSGNGGGSSSSNNQHPLLGACTYACHLYAKKYCKRINNFQHHLTKHSPFLFTSFASFSEPLVSC